jgi:hypothetical protein
MEGSFKEIRQVVNLKELAPTLNILVSDLTSHYKYRLDGNIHGFQRGYLEKKAIEFANAQEWASLGDVMALLIFDIVLFPNLKGFVDDATINASWVTKVKKNKKTPCPCSLCGCLLHLSCTTREEKMTHCSIHSSPPMYSKTSSR